MGDHVIKVQVFGTSIFHDIGATHQPIMPRLGCTRDTLVAQEPVHDQT
jgi:hypothetical protein